MYPRLYAYITKYCLVCPSEELNMSPLHVASRHYYAARKAAKEAGKDDAAAKAEAGEIYRRVLKQLRPA